MQAVLYPLSRAVIGDITVCLGADKNSIFNMLGKGESFDKKRYFYFNSELAIDFDKENKVEFIEFLGGIDGELQPVIYGISAFEVNADDLMETLKKYNNGAINDSENGYSYGFLEISVGIYREFLPEEIIESAKIENMSLDDEDVKKDLRKALHWATVGIGVNNYYR